MSRTQVGVKDSSLVGIIYQLRHQGGVGGSQINCSGKRGQMIFWKEDILDIGPSLGKAGQSMAPARNGVRP